MKVFVPAICNCLGRRGIAKRTLLACDSGLKNERKVQIILKSLNADQNTRDLRIELLTTYGELLASGLFVAI